ncbi:Putative Acyl transferase domain superfamily, beta-ketoacyl synthase, thiolase [Colletotrichum destructivum]|uniref:Acyl transferase domain superfamily, beta-ketoacyl synthase, thiolase n=1 Tax=Colletotrichum destructivum TaxID=34406 RepID=A0AAX4J461_9PEZI|nr:Putative Acyl transferase domain superfamily, beta-ketoacyl synthase, thiolase [Colletotrichum destructivum]
MQGTGTQVGDVAEMTAVANVFGDAGRTIPFSVGTIKANIGHAEAGSLYGGKGSDLCETSPVFRDSVDLYVRLARSMGFPPFLDLILDHSLKPSTKTTTQAQLATVTVQVALAAFWAACGIKPAMVMGHSLGEYYALYVAGVLSLSDILFLVGQRAALIIPVASTLRGSLSLPGDAARPWVPRDTVSAQLLPDYDSNQAAFGGFFESGTYLAQGSAQAIEDAISSSVMLKKGTQAYEVPARLQWYEECRKA